MGGDTPCTVWIIPRWLPGVAASDAALAELYITLHVPVFLAQRIESVAADQGISIGNYVAHSIEETLAQEFANFC
jgi:hypothetical protein